MDRVDPNILKEFAQTETQKRTIDAVIKHGSNTKAADALGLSRRNVDKTVKRLEKYAAANGLSPHRDLVHQTAEGFQAKRISTAYKEDGSVALQWVIQEPEKQSMQERLNYMLEGLKDDLTDYKKPTPAPEHTDADYLAMYIIGDHHFGMLADSETKVDDDDWDIKIATQMLNRS